MTMSVRRRVLGHAMALMRVIHTHRLKVTVVMDFER